MKGNEGQRRKHEGDPRVEAKDKEGQRRRHEEDQRGEANDNEGQRRKHEGDPGFGSDMVGICNGLGFSFKMAEITGVEGGK